MPRRLYSLLVGIADYHEAPRLDGCLIDVDNMTNYIKEIQESKPNTYDEVIDPVVLVDKYATRENILDHLKQVVSKLEEEDSLVFYYCGHGVNEMSQGQFFGNYNETIQSLYCYESSENNKLASKEIRFVLNQAPKEAHLLTLYDCCHSGEMSRSSRPKVQRRSASSSPASARSFDSFAFSELTTENELRSKEFYDIFPDRNIMSLGACLTREEAFGTDDGGFFTSSLLRILKANKNHINYADLLKQIDLDIRRTDKYKQAPAMSILGDRRYDQSTSWLRMNGDHLESGQSFIKYNFEIENWIFSKGMMHGLESGNNITVALSEIETADIQVGAVNLIDSIIDDASLKGLELDKETTYTVVGTDITKDKPTLSINAIDAEKDVLETIVSVLKDCDLIDFSEDLNEADYHLNLFNGLMYLSFPYHTYQPLNQQLGLADIGKDNEALKKALNNDIIILANWFNLKNLEIKDSFAVTPIRVEAKNHNSNYIDITDGNLDLVAKNRLPKKYGSVLYRTLDLRITNISDSTIHVTLLALYNSKHTISNDGLIKETFDIDPGKTKEFLNFVLAIDNYQEIYNWEYETMYLKILVNNYGKIDQTVASFFQKGFKEPLTLQSSSRGYISVDEIENPVKNALYTSEIFLKNSTVDKVTGELAEKYDAYMADKKLAPFMAKLYGKETAATNEIAKDVQINTD